MIKDYTIALVFALRQGQVQVAQENFNKILKGARGKELISSLEEAILAAARSRQEELFHAWVKQAKVALIDLVSDTGLIAAVNNFLQKLAFIICDKRLMYSAGIWQKLVLRFFRMHRQSAEAENLWAELLNLLARMVRRNWEEETSLLLRVLLHDLFAQKIPQYWYKRLWQLQLHFVAYVQWDGFTKACTMYKDVFNMQLILVKRAGKINFAYEDQLAWLQVVLRSIRDLMGNVSRTLMLDDMDVFREWYQFLCQMTETNPTRRQQMQLMFQLSVIYWQNTRPKTSRKQVEFLKDLLEPNLINEHYRDLLASLA